jgi:NitT/TauT family transport system ATP-binding protein
VSRPSPIIRLRGIDKTFPNGTRALAGFDLDVRRGEFLALLGPSGCGKSTALRLIAGLAQPTDGTIAWTQGGAASSGAAGQDIGFVFQEPTLMPWATVAGNVALPLRLKGVRRDKAAPRVADLIERVGLAAFADAYPRFSVRGPVSAGKFRRLVFGSA